MPPSPQAPVSRLTFLHLSDIHFSKRTSSVYDLDEDLRNELELDVTRVAHSLTNIAGILVTGDIAFAGKRAEYEHADRWLSKLCNKIGCPAENVWVVPGNHDIDRDSIKQSQVLQDLHSKLRAPGGLEELDKNIQAYMEDRSAKDLFFEPLQQYNVFASKYGCSISSIRPYWQEDFRLNDGSTLRVRGLNSTLVSDDLDNDGSNRLVLGGAQTRLLRAEGVEYLTLCHHPPSWMVDNDSVENMLVSRVRLQLFGHKHEKQIRQIDNRSVRIVSGATHPSRFEKNWIPQFCFISLSVSNVEQRRELVVEIRCRRWEDNQFTPDHTSEGRDVREYRILLDPWNRAMAISETPAVQASEPTCSTGVAGQAVLIPTPNVANPERRLAYLYLKLAYQTRLEIAQKLQLLQNEDESVSGGELFQRFFRRAKERQVLGSLWEECCHHNGLADQPNPFVDR